jgi:hypothetical protein
MKRKPNPTAEGIYVYLIGRVREIKSALQQRVLPAPLEPDRPLSMISAAGLAALVSPAPLDQYGEGRFEERLKDPVWTADKVMRHQSVNAFFSASGPVAPLRFGVIYSNAAKVEAMLLERGDSLSAALDRVEGCEEWAVNVYVDRSVLAEKITELSPKLIELREKARTSSKGQAYLLEKQADRMRVSEVKIRLKQTVEEIEASLRPASKDVKRIPAGESELKQAPGLTAKLVYLVRKPKVDEFKKEAKKAAARYGSSGFRLELTGPWPPYNFVE